MSYTEAKEIIGAWRKQLAQGGDNDRAMIHEIVRLRTALAAATQRIAELEAWIDAVPTGALIDYYYGSEAVSYDARQAAVGGASMTPEDIQIINLSGDVKLLEEQLAAANARAEVAEAKLAAVPVAAIRRWHENSAVFVDSGFGVYTQLDAANDSDAIGAWLEWQQAAGEVQP